MFEKKTVEVNDEFARVEQERLARVKSDITDFEKFPWLMHETVISCSLKRYVQLFLNFNTTEKNNNYENLEINDPLKIH